MANLQQTILRNKSLIASSRQRIETAKAIIEKHSQSKKGPELFDWQLNDKGVTVTWFIGDTEHEKFFAFAQLYAFINDFYCNIVDRFENDEHVQYVDNQTAEDYFIENQSDVLTDFLKNAKY